MFVGYARVSTMDQNIGLQLDALSQAGCEKIFQNKVSGAKAIRPGLQAALKSVKPGDTLMVRRLDRLERSLRHLIEINGTGVTKMSWKIDISLVMCVSQNHLFRREAMTSNPQTIIQDIRQEFEMLLDFVTGEQAYPAPSLLCRFFWCGPMAAKPGSGLGHT